MDKPLTFGPDSCCPLAPPAPQLFDVGIDLQGRLTIATEEAVIELDIERVRELGIFLAGTSGVWRVPR